MPPPFGVMGSRKVAPCEGVSTRTRMLKRRKRLSRVSQSAGGEVRLVCLEEQLCVTPAVETEAGVDAALVGGEAKGEACLPAVALDDGLELRGSPASLLGRASECRDEVLCEMMDDIG